MLIWLRCRCEMAFELEADTPFIFMLRPRSGENQWIAQQLFLLEPTIAAQEFTDSYGNLCQRLVAPAGQFSLESKTVAQTTDAADADPAAPFVPVEHLPEAMLPYLLPSRYCPSDKMGELAVEIAGAVSPGYQQAVAIIHWIREQIEYRPGSVSETLTALDTKEMGYGVCRDLAHLGITLCRCLTIPARMVVGYLEGLKPMDMHAWFEVYVGGRWFTLDATQADLGGGRVNVAYGRDAADVAVFTQFGPPAKLTQNVVCVEQLDGPPAG